MNLPALICLTSFIFLYQTKIIQPHHIIFENIGQLASAVTYLHAKVTINFSTIEDQYLMYRSILGRYSDDLSPRYEDRPSKMDNISQMSYTHRVAYDELWYENIRQCKAVVEFRKIHANYILADMETARGAMPQKPVIDSRFVNKRTVPRSNITYQYSGSNKTVTLTSEKITEKIFTSATDSVTRYRLPRLAGFASLLGGAMGTFLGLYNTYRIRQLGQDLEDVKGKHNQLVEIVDDHSRQIQAINRSLQTMHNYVKNSQRLNPQTLTQTFDFIENKINRNLQKVVHAVQMAQLRRLSVDILDAGQLIRLFSKLQQEAEKLNNILLINQPSDLFQLEVTYFSDGQDVYLLIHVPSVPRTALLDLYQLHPFPLPIDGNYSLIPIVENNVLALTPDHRKYHAQLSTTHLMDCLKINNVYICERHGVLTKNLSSSCLGSLYLQDYDGAQKLCQIQILPTRELIFQLLSNWFLIYSPVTFTADILCKNGTLSRFFIPAGITKHYLSPGCYADFRENVLLSNNAVRLESDIIHFEWKWEEEIFKTHSPTELLDSMQTIQDTGISTPTLSDINHLKATKKSGFNYLFHILGFIFSTLATALVTIMIIFLLGKYRIQIAHAISSCPCNKKKQSVDLPPANHETLPLQAPNRNNLALPKYTDSYRQSHQLYPEDDNI